MQEVRHGNDDRSLGELFRELGSEIGALIRQEMTLAKAEMKEKATHLGKQLGFIAAGGAVAYAGLLALVASLVFLLDALLPLWVAALLVGLVVAGIGGFLVMKGLQALKQADLVPRQTVETLREIKQEVQEVK